MPLSRWRLIRGGETLTPRTWPRTFWFKPISSFGLSNITAFISTSPELTMPRAPSPRPPCAAGSRRVRSRIRDRPTRSRGYIAPRASDKAVTRDACRGGRPLTEQGVTAKVLLDLSVTGYENATNRKSDWFGRYFLMRTSLIKNVSDLFAVLKSLGRLLLAESAAQIVRLSPANL